MASKNKSEKLGLNLWEGTDRPQRTDFNSDNMIVDEALGTHLENTSLHLSEKEKSRVSAPLVSTLYAGDGSGSREITLPCEAQAVMVFCSGMPLGVYDEQQSCVKNYWALWVFGAGKSAGVSVSGTSMTVSHGTTAQHGFVTCLNESGKQYRVVVLK